MKKQPEEGILDDFPSASTVRTAGTIAACSFKIFSESESRDCTRRPHMVVRYLEQTSREQHFSSREKTTEKARIEALLEPKASFRLNKKETMEIACKGDERRMFRGDKCGMKHDPVKKR